MIEYLFLIALGSIVLFLVWHRKPAGRGATPKRLEIKKLDEFILANPHAPESVKDKFLAAVQAHSQNDLGKAKAGYLEVLAQVPDESISQHNLVVLERQKPIVGHLKPVRSTQRPKGKKR